MRSQGKVSGLSMVLPLQLPNLVVPRVPVAHINDLGSYEHMDVRLHRAKRNLNLSQSRRDLRV